MEEQTLFEVPIYQKESKSSNKKYKNKKTWQPLSGYTRRRIGCSGDRLKHFRVTLSLFRVTSESGHECNLLDWPTLEMLKYFNQFAGRIPGRN